MSGACSLPNAKLRGAPPSRLRNPPHRKLVLVIWERYSYEKLFVRQCRPMLQRGMGGARQNRAKLHGNVPARLQARRPFTCPGCNTPRRPAILPAGWSYLNQNFGKTTSCGLFDRSNAPPAIASQMLCKRGFICREAGVYDANPMAGVAI